MIRMALALSGLVLTACGTAETSEPDQADVIAGGTAAETASPAPANAEEDIRHFLLQEYPDAAPMRYALAWHDLDGDGADEAIVHVVSSYLCGTGGCNTLVLTPAGPMWSKAGEISVSRTPVTVMESETNGWKDLTVAVSGGGGDAGNALLKFDGTSYPSNPTVEPAEMTDAVGTELIAEEPEFTELAAEPVSDK